MRRTMGAYADLVRYQVIKAVGADEAKHGKADEDELVEGGGVVLE